MITEKELENQEIKDLLGDESFELNDVYSEEEFYKRVIEEKRQNDDAFDEAFNWAIEYRFFELPFDFVYFIEPVFVFCDEFSALYKYFEYSQRYITKFLEVEETAYRQAIQEDPSMDTEMLYGEIMLRDEEYLGAINSEANLLMLYTLFENFLKSLVADLDENNTTKFIQNRSKHRKPMVNQYLNYLRNEYKLEISLTREMRDKLDLMRNVRNYFVHNYKGGERINLDIYSSYDNLPTLKDGRIEVDYNYVVSCFELIGEIATIISNAIVKSDIFKQFDNNNSNKDD